MSERFQFPTQAERDDFAATLDADHLAARQAYEAASMSPHIRPEHHAQCLTQRMVATYGALECDTPHPQMVDAADLAKPPGSIRIDVSLLEDGTPVIVTVHDSPYDAPGGP